MPSDSVFESWDFPVIFTVPDFFVKTYPEGGTLGFRPGTVRRSLEDSLFYFFSPGFRHKIVGTDFFKQAGIKPSQVKWASAADVALHEEGDDIK